MQNTQYISTNLSNQSPDSAREIFRQCLRQADKFIIEGKFDQAKLQLAEAKKIDSRNPFIIAFEERIALFENKISTVHNRPPIQPAAAAEKIEIKSAAEMKKEGEDHPSREMLEEKLRNQIEAEFKARYTEELRKAEQQAANILNEEKEQLKHQQQILRQKFDDQLIEARKQLELEYQKRLDEEIAKAEEQLEKQHRSELAFLENEMKTQLTQQYENQIHALQEKIKKEQTTILNDEHQTFEEREQELKEQFNQKLLESLQETEQRMEQRRKEELALRESEIRREMSQQYEIEIQDLRERLTLEQNNAIDNDKRSFKEREEELRKQFNGKLLDSLKETEKQKDKKHKEELRAVEDEVKARLTEQYENELRNIREKLQQSHEEILAKEKQTFEIREQKLKEQFNQKLLDALRKTETMFQEQSLQQLREERGRVESELRTEFEARLLSEKETLKQQSEDLQRQLEERHVTRMHETSIEIEKKVREQLEMLRKKEEAEFEQRRVSLRIAIEDELGKKHEIQICLERERLQQETETIIETEKRRLEDEYAALIQAQNAQVQRLRSEMRSEMEQTLLARLERVAYEYDHKMELLGARIPDTKEERFSLYREKMLTCYKEGQPSVEGARMLMQLKELLELTFDEHLTVEADVRLDLYVKQVERKILSGEISPQNIEALANLKQQFNINSEEALRLEPFILSSFQRIATKGKLLIVDDDDMLLQTLEHLFTDCGYQVMTALDIETALERLRSNSVDLILSDIKFGIGELDGFKFYKIVQEQPHLRTIPFVFMSSLTDGVIIRSGVQLGVDDYITKPMDPDLLIATIEGKLKRYRNLRSN